jgi:hypothetical protein
VITRARAERPRAGEPTIREQLKQAGLSVTNPRLRAALSAHQAGAPAPAAHGPQAGPGSQDGQDSQDGREETAQGNGPGSEAAAELLGPVLEAAMSQTGGGDRG